MTSRLVDILQALLAAVCDVVKRQEEEEEEEEDEEETIGMYLWDTVTGFIFGNDEVPGNEVET